jgi:putative membrane protein
MIDMVVVTRVLSSVVAHDWDGHMWGGGGGWMWLWGSLMMLFWVGVIGVIVWLVIRAGHGGVGGSRPARRILDERYARGEIETDDYEARLEKLR